MKIVDFGETSISLSIAAKFTVGIQSVFNNNHEFQFATLSSTPPPPLAVSGSNCTKVVHSGETSTSLSNVAKIVIDILNIF